MKQMIFGKKLKMTEGYLGDVRVGVTKIALVPVVSKKLLPQKSGSNRLQVLCGDGKSKRKNLYVREINEIEGVNIGDTIDLGRDLKVGMVVNIQATSKGKGTAGVMKRWNFKGGPRTHGQSDRARAPGSIGQGTTPGRVLKGRHMAGRMGHATVTVMNLPIVAIDKAHGELWIAGQIPGVTGGKLIILPTPLKKSFAPLVFLKGYNKTVDPIVSETATEVSEIPTVEESVSDKGTI